VAIGAAVILIAYFRKPVLALYGALFVVFLPIGFIPPEIHSLLNRSMTVLAFLTWLFAVFFREFRITLTISASLMLTFLAWGVVTLLWARYTNTGATLLQAYTLRFVLFLLLIPNEIRTKKTLNGLMKTLALNGWLLMLVSVITILLEGYESGARLKLFSENQNTLGILALVTMTGVLWQAMQPSKRYRVLKMLIASVFLIMAIGLTALSGSRGSAISIVVTMLVFWFWKPTRLWGKISLIILVIAVIITPFVFTTILDRFAGTTKEAPLGGREVLWQRGSEIIKENPLLGVGIGNSSFELKSSFGYWGPGWASMHNPILVIWSETGFPGLILYLSVLISAVCSFLRQYRLHRSSNVQWLMPYFALISSVFLGYLLSWIKGGGMEYHFSYFLMLALLLIPSRLNIEASQHSLQSLSSIEKIAKPYA
jgi:O-antigen ligase